MTKRRLRGSPRLTLLCLAFLLGSLLPTGTSVHAVPCEPSLPVDDAQARRILAEERPFQPTDRDLFFSFQHSDWADTAPLAYVDGPKLTVDETREALRAFLQRRFPCAPGRVRDGLAVFGDPAAQQKIPDPTLRAALAALTGTLGEPAIDYLLFRTPVALISFNAYINYGEGAPLSGAGVYTLADGTQRMVIDVRYRFAPFGALSALLFHEALHTGVDGDEAGLPEEAVASALEALVHMEMLLTDPTLAEVPDDLTRINSNHVTLVRLNSGPAESDRLTLFVPNSDVNIDPTAAEPLTEFYEYYARNFASSDPGFRERETAGNPLLQQVLEALAEPGESPPANADFDRATLEFVDQSQAVLSPAELIAVACILKLEVPCD